MVDLYLDPVLKKNYNIANESRAISQWLLPKDTEFPSELWELLRVAMRSSVIAEEFGDSESIKIAMENLNLASNEFNQMGYENTATQLRNQERIWFTRYVKLSNIEVVPDEKTDFQNEPEEYSEIPDEIWPD